MLFECVMEGWRALTTLVLQSLTLWEAGELKLGYEISTSH